MKTGVFTLTIRVFTYFHSLRWFCFHPLSVSPLDLSTWMCLLWIGLLWICLLWLSHQFLECLEIGD
jgi:hypothetical protein